MARMEFVPALTLVKKAVAKGYAVPSFCAWDAESIAVVLRGAAKARAPVMLMMGPSEFGVLRPMEMARIAKALAADYDIPVALHLDHAEDLELVNECLEARYTSVMLDYSTRPFAENAAALRQTVEWAHPRGVTVEGEIGHVGKVDGATLEGGAQSALTDPASAKALVQETGLDMLAVSIGNAHGLYTKLPQFDFKLLEQLARDTGVPLVLHGGSGTPRADLRRAIALGIGKVNVASELVHGYRKTLMAQWQAGQNLWTPCALPSACACVAEVVERWFEMTGAAGQA